MQDRYQGLSGPDFLDKVADAEAANGLDVNADTYRQRAHEWKQLERDHELLQQRNAALQRALDQARRQPLPVRHAATHGAITPTASIP
jgi:hypothetical protein